MNQRHFLVAGAQRSGTTLLYQLLDQHPAIEMARPVRPEPKFFLRENVRSVGRASYLAEFFYGKPGASLLGEKCTSYMERSDIAARVLELFGDVRMVFLLRDPVERALSNYRFSVENGVESLPLEEAIKNEEERRDRYEHARYSVSPFAYINRGHYHRDLEAWRNAVGKERMYVMVFENLVRTAGALRDFLAWLEVDPGFSFQLPSEAPNASLTATQPAAELRRWMVEQFRESNQILSEQFDLDISLWQK